jgi:hypothetical protein
MTWMFVSRTMHVFSYFHYQDHSTIAVDVNFDKNELTLSA